MPLFCKRTGNEVVVGGHVVTNFGTKDVKGYLVHGISEGRVVHVEECDISKPGGPPTGIHAAKSAEQLDCEWADRPTMPVAA